MNITETIPSYPYVQWSDDPDVVAFFTAYNQLSQQNLDEINSYTLPIFLAQQGALLDWAATSIYGVPRPSLSYGGAQPVGPLNTWELNTEQLNDLHLENNSQSFVANDQVYQRIIQWNTFKGDGYQFTIRWLKRRVQRFLTGEIFPDQTYQVSISFTDDTHVLILIKASLLIVTGGAFYNAQPYNALMPLNGISVMSLAPADLPVLARALAAALNSGVLLLPFQYTFTVQVT